MVGSVSLDGGSVCGRTVDPSHPQLLSPEGTGDMPVGQPPTCPHTEEPVPRRRTLGRGAPPRTPVARLTSCARTHVHGGDRRTSGAAAAWGRPVPALERIFRPRGTKHAALRPPSQCPGGAPVPTVSGATADLSGPASPARPPVAASPASPHGPRPARSPSRLPRLRPPRSPLTVAARPPRPRPAPRGSRSLRSLRSPSLLREPRRQHLRPVSDPPSAA